MNTYTTSTKNGSSPKANASEKKAVSGKVLSSGFLILLAYLGVEFLPSHMEVIDNIGVHWLYLSVVNLLVGGFLVFRAKFSLLPIKNRLGYSYLAFCGWCALSVCFAFNRIEGVVSFSRMLITATMFVNCAIILNSDRQLFRRLIWLMVASGTLQAILVVFSFLQCNAVDTITLGLGNKNILSASLMIKFALAVFAISTTKGLHRWLAASGMGVLMVAIYGLSSRSAMVGMFMSMLLYVVAVMVARKRSFVSLAITVALFGSVTIVMQIWSASSKNAYQRASVVERISSVKEEAAGKKQYSRSVYWQYAARYIADHPAVGGGLGNWKINSIPYEKKLLANDYHSKHVHNDVLELAADTGIPGALIYLSIFAIGCWIAVRILVTGRAVEDVLLFLAPFAGMVAYLCDAFFNFPLERANMQVLFAVLLALGCSSYTHFFGQSTAAEKSRLSIRSAHMAILLVVVSTVFISWMSFRAMQGQFVTWEDMLGSKPPSHSFDEIESYFGAIPNITESGIPVADIKAKYLLDENRDDEALQTIAVDGNSNPYMPFRYMILGTIYRKKNDLDSAYHYFSQAWERAPLVYTYYAELQKICAIRKDSLALKRNFAQISALPQEARAWIDIALWSSNVSGNNIDGALAYLEEGKRQFPENKDIDFSIHSLKAFYYTRKEDFRSAIDEGLKALQFGETYAVVQNLALSYFANREYPKALQYFDTSIKKFGQGNGEAVYFRGQCYYIANDRAHACADFQTARNLKYPVEAGLFELCK